MNKTYHSLGVVGLLILLTALLPLTASGQQSRSECHHHAYTSDSYNTHFSLVKNDSLLIGQRLSIESNCQITFKTSNFQYTEDYFFTTNLPLDLTTFTVIVDNQTFIYSNFTIFPSDTVELFDLTQGDDLTISDSKLWTSELLSHAITFIILYIFSTSIVYRFAKNRVDNSIEVVI